MVDIIKKNNLNYQKIWDTWLNNCLLLSAAPLGLNAYSPPLDIYILKLEIDSESEKPQNW